MNTKSLLLSVVVLFGLSACGQERAVSPLAEFYPYVHASPADLRYQPVRPESVAVLTEEPHCAFSKLGLAAVHAPDIIPDAKTVKALQQQAALYGADAIILNPNVPENCTDFRICKGKGIYNSAVAIKY